MMASKRPARKEQVSIATCLDMDIELKNKHREIKKLSSAELTELFRIAETQLAKEIDQLEKELKEKTSDYSTIKRVLENRIKIE